MKHTIYIWQKSKPVDLFMEAAVLKTPDLSNIVFLRYMPNPSKWRKFQKVKILQGVPKRIRLFFSEYLGNQMSGFQIIFCLLKTEIHTDIFNTEPFLCDWRGPGYLKKKKTEQIYSYSYGLKATSKPHNLAPASPTGPRLAMIVPIWLWGALVAQTDKLEFKLFLILIVFKICGSSRLNNLRIYHHDLIKKTILFGKDLSPL